jgi:3-hydroxyisobutyrate dehydrogenase-like beta-hydroxyacid dehydrogenase
MRRIGFLGFGEAGSLIATGLVAAGFRDLVAYDLAQDTGPLVRERAERIGVRLVSDPDELAASADVIISAVTCSQSEVAVERIAPALTAGAFLLDINSTAAGSKQRNAERVVAVGAAYVDVAVMANASSDLTRLPLLLAGPRADEVLDLLAPAPIVADVVSDVPGDAARIKMFRSLFVKGLEALSLEAMMACFPSGVHEQVLASFEDSFGHFSFGELVRHLIERHAVHGARRADELDEVAISLREVGVEPLMAEAGHRRMLWDVERGLQARFVGGADPDWNDVLVALDEARRAESGGTAR